MFEWESLLGSAKKTPTFPYENLEKIMMQKRS